MQTFLCCFTCNKDTFQCLKEWAVDVIPPEGIQTGDLREFDLTHNGTQVPSFKINKLYIQYTVWLIRSENNFQLSIWYLHDCVTQEDTKLY